MPIVQVLNHQPVPLQPLEDVLGLGRLPKDKPFTAQVAVYVDPFGWCWYHPEGDTEAVAIESGQMVDLDGHQGRLLQPGERLMVGVG